MHVQTKGKTSICSFPIRFTQRCDWPVSINWALSSVANPVADPGETLPLPSLPLNFFWTKLRPSSETQGQSVGSGEKAGRKFLLRAKEPLGTDSQRTISKNSSGCRLLIGHKKCFVLLCPIGEHISISYFRVFLHDGYCLDHGLSVVAYRWFLCNLGRHK